MSRRVWSRTGHLIDTLASSPNRPAYAYSWRITLHLVGCVLIAIGVAGMFWNDFGPGPLDLVIWGVREALGISLTLAVWLTTGTLLLVAWALGKRPGLGNVVTVLAVGPLTQVTLALLAEVAPPGHVAAKVGIHVAATALVGIGAGINLFARLGAGTGELLASALAGRTGYADSHVRLACELSWLGLGVAIGGPIGIGTAIVAILIGPFVARGYRTVDGAITGVRVATRGRIEWARAPLPAPPLDITGQIPITGQMAITGQIPVMSLSAGD